MNADLILVLDTGRIATRGTHETLLVQDGLYRRIYDLQARIEDEIAQEVDEPLGGTEALAEAAETAWSVPEA